MRSTKGVPAVKPLAVELIRVAIDQLVGALCHFKNSAWVACLSDGQQLPQIAIEGNLLELNAHIFLFSGREHKGIH